MTDLSFRASGLIPAALAAERFHALDLLASPIWHAGPEGLCDWVNRAWLELTGREMAQEMGDGWSENIHPDDRDCCLAAYRKCLTARRAFRLEYRLRHRDGSYRWAVSAGTPEIDGAGRFKGYFGCCHDIHDFRMAEERLVHERQFLNAILESVDAIVVACDRDGKLIIYNRQARDTDGRDMTDIQPEQWAHTYDLLDPVSGKPLAPERVPLYRAWKGEKVVDQEIDVIDCEGRRRRRLSSGTPLYGAQGEVLGAVILAKDVTAQREAEELRRRDHAMRRAIADILALSLGNAPLLAKAQQALAAIVKSGCCLSLQQHEYVRLRLLIKGGMDLVAATAEAAPELALEHCSFPVVVQGEEVGSLQISTTQALEPGQCECFGGTVVPMLASMIQRSWREEKITQLSRVVEQSSTGTLITDAAGKIIYANPALCRTRGYALDDVIGERPSLFKSGNTPEAVYRDLWSTILAGETWSGELQNRSKDGSLRWERVSISPIRDGEDKVVNFVASCEDLTMVKQVQQERETLASRLSQAEKMESIGHLADGIAHDFNNILVAILGFTELAQKEFGTRNAKLNEYLERSLRAGLRAKDLVGQLLTFSRSGPLDARPMAPKPIVEEVVNLLRSTIPSSLSITLDIPDELPYIRINPVQMHQVIMNLCINARDATGGRGRLDIALRQARVLPETACASCHKTFDGDYLAITVRDNGSGIPERQRDRIFDPFFTTKDVGKGTGLGLSVVHGIIHLHGGHVTLSVPAVGGTQFTVYLPIASALEEEVQSAARDARIGPVRGHVLVIDDEAGVADFAREVLEGMGCRVTTRTDSLAAWDLFAQAPHAVDLVIVDQTMPNLMGRDLCARMLALRPELPIILWTGYSADVDEKSAATLGIRRFMLKPVSATAISSAVSVLLQEKKEGHHDPSPLPHTRD